LSSFSTQDYARLLRHMAHPDVKLIEQAPDGAVMLGELGEKIVDSRTFYAIFPTDQEWRLVHKAEVLGTLPLSNIISVGSLILFAGRRWRVVSVDDPGKVLDVTPHKSARLPKFESAFSESVSDEFVAEMRAVLCGIDEPPYLDKEGVRLLGEARAAYREFELDSVRVLGVGRDTHLFLWRGTAVTNAFAVALQAAGLECEPHDLGVTLPETTGDEARAIVQQISRADGLTAQELSGFVENIRSAKYDDLISEEILRNEWRKRNEACCSEICAVAKSIL
jgi:ATP-dependent Lhr-like helicase